MKTAQIKNKSKDDLLDLLYSFEKALTIESRYHLILDNMIEGFQLLDFDYRYLYVNNTVVKQSKFSKDELMGYRMMDKFKGIEDTAMFQTLKACMETRSTAVFENEFQYPDNSTAWFRLSMQPVDEGLFILSMDITESKKAEKKREEHIYEIEQLLFKISHQLRQPVCHLQGIGNLLQRSLVTVEELDEFMVSIKSSVDLIDIYTKEITDFVSGMKMNAGNNVSFSLYPQKTDTN